MINMDVRRMNVTQTAGNGVVNHETIFTFNQTKNRISARYGGGQVTRGMLVGSLQDSLLKFNYVQEHDDGKIAGGESTCEISVQPDDKLMLVENFDWEQGQGRNVFEEI